ncbi:MAG: tetratricopeptide repeat protein [Gammaproteobacteria bacterium]
MKRLITALFFVFVLHNAVAENDLNTALKLHVNKDYPAAFEIFKELANRGNASAQANIGYYYDNGYAVEQNSEEAVRWYRRAAENGSVFAQYNLGIMYEIGEGVARDYGTAYMWFYTAAEGGDREAAVYLGLFNEEGLGRRVDKVRAFAWYSVAAERHELYGAQKRDAIARVLNENELMQARALTAKLLHDLGDIKDRGNETRI